MSPRGPSPRSRGHWLPGSLYIGAAEPLGALRHEACASQKFGLVSVLTSCCHSFSIYTGIVTHGVIFWSVNFRNILTDKVNVGIFTSDVDVFRGLFGIIL